MGALLDRYFVPARVAPRTPAAMRRVAGSIATSFRRDDTASALPSAVGIDVSDACNIACTVCSREIAWDKRKSPFLKLDDFRRIYDGIRPPYLSLSGYGETTLNKDLPAIVAHATQAGSRVTVVSNGTLLDDRKTRQLVDAGLAKLKVSMDGAEAHAYELHRAGARFEKVVHNVERLIAMRDALRLPAPIVEIQLVIFRDNVDQVAPMIELCARRLPSVEPNFLVMFTYGEQAGFVEKTLPANDAASLEALHAALALAERHGFRRTRGSLESAIRQLTTDLSTAPCYIPWYSVIVSTDGEVYPCCYHSVRGTSVGNALATPFAEIWNGERMRAFRRALRARRCDDKVCATCRYEDAPMERVFSAAARLPGVGALRR